VIDQDAVIACADLAGRTGAREFVVGYLHEDVPAEQAGWYAEVTYQGVKIICDDYPGPDQACDALARRLLHGARCTHCHGLVTLSDQGAVAPGVAHMIDGSTYTSEDAATWPQCRWRRMGDRWVRGCERRIPPPRRGD
jgi:hypothetical protein